MLVRVRRLAMVMEVRSFYEMWTRMLSIGMKQISIYILIIGLVWGFWSPSCRTLHSTTFRVQQSSNSLGMFCAAAGDSVFMGFGNKNGEFQRNNVMDVNLVNIDGSVVEEIPQLPAPNESDGDATHRLEVDGPAISMSELGPIIVNTDGTLRRIENWAQLTKAEQASTVRIVSRRNKKRLEALKELELEDQSASNGLIDQVDELNKAGKC